MPFRNALKTPKNAQNTSKILHFFYTGKTRAKKYYGYRGGVFAYGLHNRRQMSLLAIFGLRFNILLFNKGIIMALSNFGKKKVAFICVHNSCRSQIAEALGKKLASDVFESYSAGTETKPQINQDAVRLMKREHGIDMEATQRSKLLSDIPAVDVVITMGCNVQCPALPCSHREDWGLEDPTGQADAVFLQTIKEIERKVLRLKEQLA